MKSRHYKDQIRIITTIIIVMSLISVPSLFSFNVTADQAPDTPIDPYPEDGSTNMNVNTELSVYVSDEDGDHLDITFYNADDDGKIATVYDVQSGTRVSITWTNLEYDSVYHWYAVSDDGTDQVTSDTWSFKTGPDVPPRLTDNSDSDPTTGDPFIFNSTVVDNDDIENVYVDYNTDVNSNSNISMINEKGDYYTEGIVIPSNASSFDYKIKAEDIKGNWNSTKRKFTAVIDDDKPRIENIKNYPESQSLDGYVNITAEIYDNKGLSSIEVNITRTDGSYWIEDMKHLENDTWYFNKTYSRTGEYGYRITATDSSSNTKTSTKEDFVIGDITKPEIKDRSDLEAFTGDPYEFECTVTDDDGVSEVFVEYWFGYNYLNTENASLSNVFNKRWSYTIMIPQDSLEPLHYKISTHDHSGNWNSSGMVRTVEVKDNDHPIPDAGGDRTVDMGEIVTFDASDSHDNIDIVRYEWKIEGRTFQGERINYMFKEVGEFDVTLIVYDSRRAESEEITVTVVDTEKPTADAGDDLNIEEDTEVILDGSDSYDNLGIGDYVWTIDGKTKLGGKNPSYYFTEPGTYFVELNVTDRYGNYDTDTITVWVKDITDPTAEAGENWTIYSDQRVKLNGSLSSDNLEIESYEWHIDNQVYYGRTLIHEFSDVGEYKVTLKVEDGSGNSDTDSIFITVKDGENPTAEAGDTITTNPSEMVTLDASDSKDNTGIVNYTWTVLGENEVLYGPRPEYEFDESGTYDVELTVMDENGNFDQDILKVNVKDRDTSLSYLSILLPILVIIISVAGLMIFFFMNIKSDEKGEIEEEPEDDGEEEAITEYTKEELLQKLESGELSKKDLADMLAESHENLRKDIIEIYQYLEILKSKARDVREDREKDIDDEESSEEDGSGDDGE